LLLAAATLAVCPDWGKAGLVRARHPASVAGSAAFAAAAVWLVHAGFSAQGIPLYPQPWEPWRTVVSTVAGAGEELWLRGLLPSVVPGSPLAAFALSELGTLVLHGGARGEVVAWHLVSGAVFFAVRRVTGSVWGPVLARGVGDAALWSLLRL
jgi:membrane protease YdiL (CAAX protease family)